MIVEVSVVTGSPRFFLDMKDGRLRAHLRNQPEKNKANLELIKELSSLLKAPVRLVSGATSRRKRLDIGLGEQNWADFISNL